MEVTNRINSERNVIAIVKGEERFVFIYSDHQKKRMLQTLGRFANRKELNFSWYDAAVLSQKVRQSTEDTK